MVFIKLGRRSGYSLRLLRMIPFRWLFLIDLIAIPLVILIAVFILLLLILVLVFSPILYAYSYIQARRRRLKKSRRTVQAEYWVEQDDQP